MNYSWILESRYGHNGGHVSSLKHQYSGGTCTFSFFLCGYPFSSSFAKLPSRNRLNWVASWLHVGTGYTSMQWLCRPSMDPGLPHLHMLEIMLPCKISCPVFRKWPFVVPPSLLLKCAAMHYQYFGRLCFILCINLLLIRAVALDFISRPSRTQLGLLLQLLTYFGH